MNWIVKNFLRGVIIVVPIALTIYLIYEIFTRIDRLLNLAIPGVGFVLMILLMILVGALASNFFVRKFLELTNAIFTRAPLVRLIYAAIRDLLEAFVGDQKRFNQPVAVSLFDGVRTVGFMTQENLEFLSMPGYVAVYLPFSYSMAGSLVLVPSARVERLAVDSASLMALVISGGVSRVTA
ncbi:MAG TPA: DUF502 domain-containing protein [Thermoanaerobaculia bacterium]